MASGEEVLRVENLSDGQLLRDVSFQLHQGEIIGFAGLVGAGKTELAKCIFGARPYPSGQVFLRGQAVRWETPRQAIAAGVALVAEDRRHEGLITILFVRDNITLPALRQLTALDVFIDWGGVHHLVDGYIKHLNIVTPTRGSRHELSGGNTESRVAKWLSTKALCSSSTRRRAASP